MEEYRLDINKTIHRVKVDSNTPLLWVLRDHLNLVGTKYGCGKGLCGACTIHINGQASRSCITPVSAVEGKKITTIEAFHPDKHQNKLHPVQKAWIEEQVAQCGYCQSGQIMSAIALLQRIANPTEQDIVNAMNGNICRCGTYPRIIRAIRSAANRMKKEALAL